MERKYIITVSAKLASYLWLLARIVYSKDCTASGGDAKSYTCVGHILAYIRPPYIMKINHTVKLIYLKQVNFCYLKEVTEIVHKESDISIKDSGLELPYSLKIMPPSIISPPYYFLQMYIYLQFMPPLTIHGKFNNHYKNRRTLRL